MEKGKPLTLTRDSATTIAISASCRNNDVKQAMLDIMTNIAGVSKLGEFELVTMVQADIVLQVGILLGTKGFTTFDNGEVAPNQHDLIISWLPRDGYALPPLPRPKQ